MEFEDWFFPAITVFIIFFMAVSMYSAEQASEEIKDICAENNMLRYENSTCYNASDNTLYQIINVNGTTHLIKTTP